MAELPCGRTQLCGPCERIQPTERTIVCRTIEHIGYISGYGRLDKVGKISLRKFVDAEMEGVMSETQYVTDELLDTAVESLEELIELRREI